MARSLSIKLVAALILNIIQITTSAKNNASPVYEVINEQARMDDIRLSSGPSILPYGNPLAGNSAHNARLHASNQQAMFNAERIRQHKAQLQRLTQGPPIIDSYMKAYHESQESHQLALEQQQAIIREDVTTQPTNPRKQIRVRVPQNPKQRTTQSNHDSPVRNVQRTQIPKTNQRQEFKSRTSNVEAMEKIIRANGVKERNRNHRSYDSVEYQQYLESKQPHTNLATAFDEGVTIKPNGNVGLAPEQEQTSSILQSKTISNGKYLPKNVHNFHTVQEINALELLLMKNPNEQLSEFKTLIDSGRSFEKDKNSHAPSDLYYFLKDPTIFSNNEHTYTDIPNTYANDHLRDYTPITEEIDDIENPTPYKNSYVTLKLSTEAPSIESSTLHTNYYKVEVASQTVSTDYKPSKINEELDLHEDPSYEIIHYGNPHENSEDGLNESYLNHQHKGVQHLTEDGTGVSAYGDENLHYAANYEFGYRVRDADSGNFYGQYEAKKGESTKGHYHVLLPDGRMQKVMYSAGPSGYHADISYDHLQNE